MPVLRRTYSDVYRDGKKRLRDNTSLNNFNPQGIVKGYLDILGSEMDKLYDTADYIYRSVDPTKAVGSDLDKIGALVGKYRNESVVATDFTYTNFYFKIDPRLGWTIQKLIEQNYTPEEIDVLKNKGFITLNNTVIEQLIIPIGITVSNTGKSINYSTTAPTILENTSNGYSPIVSFSPGSDSNVQSNVLIAHNINTIPELRKIAHFIKCSNQFPIQNGKYSQSDDEFRYRITTSTSAISTNELAIRSAALSVPGVRDLLLERHKFGNGTVHIILDGTSPLISNGLIEVVTQRVQQAASSGDKIFISAPEYIGIELTFYLEMDQGITSDGYLREAAANVVIQYINDLPLGGEIIWNQIISNVIAIDGIKDFYPSVFKSGIYNPFTKINSKQVILRFSNQKAKYNQKFYCDAGIVSCCS